MIFTVLLWRHNKAVKSLKLPYDFTDLTITHVRQSLFKKLSSRTWSGIQTEWYFPDDVSVRPEASEYDRIAVSYGEIILLQGIGRICLTVTGRTDHDQKYQALLHRLIWRDFTETTARARQGHNTQRMISSGEVIIWSAQKTAISLYPEDTAIWVSRRYQTAIRWYDAVDPVARYFGRQIHHHDDFCLADRKSVV